ncbi:hypothetical protein BH11BAC3_BH11BAC3_22400 [soil metagenome]
MQAFSTPIIGFIRDFNLKNASGIVNFIATIELKTSNNISRIKSDVFILSVDNKSLDVVHLLNPEIEQMNFPSMFQSKREAFSYIDNICLLIVGNNVEAGDYVLSIFPDKN